MKFELYIVCFGNYMDGKEVAEKKFYYRKDAVIEYKKIASRIRYCSTKRKSDVVPIVYLCGIDKQGVYHLLRRKGGLK